MCVSVYVSMYVCLYMCVHVCMCAYTHVTVLYYDILCLQLKSGTLSGNPIISALSTARHTTNHAEVELAISSRYLQILYKSILLCCSY